jgi:transcription elongation GreA/GreB family factor
MELVKNKIAVKKNLLSECTRIHKESLEAVKEAMDMVQESAHEEQDSSEEKFESFRAQCLIDREMYAKQLQDGIAGLATLNLIVPNKENETIALGSVVITEAQSYFVAISIGEVKIDDGAFYAISTHSPIYKAMSGRRKGETFNFRGKDIKIIDTF